MKDEELREAFARIDKRFDRIDGRLDRIDGRLDRVEETVREIAVTQRQIVTLLTDHSTRLDRLEQNAFGGGPSTLPRAAKSPKNT